MKARRIPTRTCIACRSTRPKRELIRVVRTPGGEIVADATGRRPGRGAYLDADPACLERGLAGGSLAKALEAELSENVRARLREEVAAIARERSARDLRSLAAQRSGAAAPGLQRARRRTQVGGATQETGGRVGAGGQSPSPAPRSP